MDREDQFRNAEKTADRVAEENKARTSNGNQWDSQPSKSGGAERGGPGIETALDRQPPDSTRPEENTDSDELTSSRKNPSLKNPSLKNKETQQ